MSSNRTDEKLLVQGVDVELLAGTGPTATTILEGATFTIRPGEHVALCGRSGTGKSTLLCLLAGILEPTQGSMSWPALGPIDTLRPQHISIAFQGPSLMAPLTLRENVSLPLLLLGHDAASAQSEADAMLDRVGLTAVAGHLPEELSGGQIQRAGVARALVGRPQLILVDEPTGQSDRMTGDVVVHLLEEVAGTLGSALVVATHDERIADRAKVQWRLIDRQITEDIR